MNKRKQELKERAKLKPIKLLENDYSVSADKIAVDALNKPYFGG